MVCVVVIPIYRSKLEPFEKISLLRLKQLIKKDVYLIAPDDLCIDEYKNLWSNISIKYFSSEFFKSVLTYNKLMLSTEMYERFASEYEWMLVYQLDAFLFHANLDQFVNSTYDYFGAPWIPSQLVHPRFKNPYLLKILGAKVSVGNGGLSLRRISSTLKLLRSKYTHPEGWSHNEDGFFAYWGVRSSSFKSCTFEMGSQFAFEKNPEILFRVNGEKLPLGCHGLPKYNDEFYISIIRPLLNDIAGVDDALIAKYESLGP
jgi:hypothetical protein